MEKESLGLIETLGLVAAIEAADAGAKAANVTLRGYDRARSGLITVIFDGDVAAVRAAVSAGAAAARKVGKVVSAHVIARPDNQLKTVSNGTKAVRQADTLPVESLVQKPGPAVETAVPDIQQEASVASVCEPEPAPTWSAAEEETAAPPVAEEVAVAEELVDTPGASAEEEEAEVALVAPAPASAGRKKDQARKLRGKRKA